MRTSPVDIHAWRRAGRPSYPSPIRLALGLLACTAGLSFSNPFSGPTEDYEAIDAGVPGFVGPGGDGDPYGAGNYLNKAFAGWATVVTDYAPAAGLAPDWTNTLNALGPVSGDHFGVVSLGDLDQGQIDGGTPPGSIVLSFDVPISDEQGPDFAVFENGFASGDGIFGELGFMEVSTDGITFSRFPGISSNDTPIHAFAPFDVRNVYNLCGKHANGDGASWATPFDLSDLADDLAVLSGDVNLTNIWFVRIVDIPGSGDFQDTSVPPNPIYDPWVTIGSGGIDLEAVGILNSPGHARVVTRVLGTGYITPYGMPGHLVAVEHGSNITFDIIAEAGEILDVRVNGASIGPTNQVRFSNVQEDQYLEAIISTWATNGVPVAWLEFFGHTNGTPDEVALLDLDGDGATAWEEYHAGTRPDDPASVFEFLGQARVGESNIVAWRSGTNGSLQPFSVESTTDLNGTWSMLTTGVERTGTGTNVWGETSGDSRVYYRIKVDSDD